MRSEISSHRADNISQLLSLHDNAFVSCAYLTLLGRSPDASGLQTFVRQIRQGKRKISVIYQLHNSTEGRAFAAKLPGLSKALAAYKRSRWPIVGRVYRAIMGIDGDGTQERKLRSIENAIHASGREVLDRLEHIEAMVTSRSIAPGRAAVRSSFLESEIPKIVSPAKPKPAKGGFIFTQSDERADPIE